MDPSIRLQSVNDGIVVNIFGRHGLFLFYANGEARKSSWLFLSPLADHERQRQPLLILVFALLVGVAGLAHGLSAEEQNLGDAFVGVNLGGQRSRVADLDGNLAAPFRLQRRDIYDDAATGIS